MSKTYAYIFAENQVNIAKIKKNVTFSCKLNSVPSTSRVLI